MKLEQILKATAKVVLPLYATLSIANPVLAKPTSNSMYNFMVGWMEDKEGNLEVALKNYQSALAADPRSAYLNNEIAEVLMYANQINNAAMYLKKAISLEKNFVKPHTNIAMIHVSKKNFEGAIEESKFALSIEPNNLTAISTLAECYFILKDYPEAKYNFEKMIELDVNQESSSHATYRLGQINFQDRNYLSAIRYFGESFKTLDITDPYSRLSGCDALHYMTLSYINLKMYDEAKEAITTLFRIIKSEVDSTAKQGMDELMKSIVKQNLLEKIDKGIQEKNNKNKPNAAIPK